MDALHLPKLFETIIAHACQIVPELSHIDPKRVFVGVRKLAPRRLGQTVGLLHVKKRGLFCPAPKTIIVNEREIFYIVTLSARLVSHKHASVDALETVMHELWHIGPQCDGKIRVARHGKKFNETVRGLCNTYLNSGGTNICSIDHNAHVHIRHLRGHTLHERTTTLARLLPTIHTYTCPNGHLVTRPRRISRKSSCATCSKKFHPDFLLRPVL